MRRVVITGMGTINPLGNNVETFWNNIKENKNGLSYIKDLKNVKVADDFEIKIVGAVKDFDCSEYIDKKEIKRIDRFTQFAIVSSMEALKMSGSDFKNIDPFRAGVIIGCGIGGLELTQQEHSKYLEKGPNRVSVFYVPMMIANMAAGTVSMKTGFKGDNFATVTACSSATHAIGEAFRKVKDGYLDICLCGGTESCITEFALGGFNNMKALSKSDDINRASIPFDKERNGFVLGEGCGILLLEEYEHAVSRGATIYAEISGYGATCDAYHMTSPAPDGEAASMAMSLACKEAGVAPEQVDYINAHGTSTSLNDKYETNAIKLVLGEEAAAKVKINSTKSMIGHLLGAAGAVEAIATVLQVKNSLIHKTLGYKIYDEECDLDYCVDGNVEQEVNVALTNSLGFGGHNATLCIKKVK
ncbi:MAG: beta-ketoacyl-ACP synthase II [Clostridiales bacterium]|jgi:3-oxoacyl-[acyl-carrier-protein] synthase II|nr:beta-ketoacyl-ACP synthase II [Clostridiales bacterium]